MNIHIPNGQKLRVSTNRERKFIDVSATPNEEGLTVAFYSFQKQLIKFKNGTYKMFVFEEEQDVSEFDFGFWSDAETVWKSF